MKNKKGGAAIVPRSGAGWPGRASDRVSKAFHTCLFDSFCVGTWSGGEAVGIRPTAVMLSKQREKRFW